MNRKWILFPAVFAVAVALTGCLNPEAGKARQKALEIANQNNLRQIGIACVQYMDTIGNMRYYPPTLKALYDQKVVTEPRVFVYPDEYQENAGWQCSYNSIFDMTDKKLTDRMPSDLMIVWDAKSRNNTMCILFCDGHTEAVSEGQFQNYLEQTKAFVEQAE